MNKNNNNQQKDDAYQQAGVDIGAGNELVKTIAQLAKKTHRPFLRGGIGGFAAVLDLAASGFREPLLTLSCDGVGTKLDLAIRHNLFDGIGFDLVAMAVNDILGAGATPLAFLDYYATGKLDKTISEKLLTSITKACMAADCVLAGGETAEMPGFYDGGKLDLAGFVVGAVEKSFYDNRPAMAAGDKLLGLTSSGFHSNGYSLIRHLLQQHNIDEAAPPPFASDAPTLAHALLTPTRIYKKIFDHINHDIKGAAHITGGGLVENIPRIFANNLTAHLDLSHWPLPPCFAWLQALGDISNHDMWRTFNCGIGMVLVVAPDKEATLCEKLAAINEPVIALGHIQQQTEPGNITIIS